MSYIEAIEYATPTQRKYYSEARERQRSLRGVPDHGIDLSRQTRGITGYEWTERAEARRQQQIKAALQQKVEEVIARAATIKTIAPPTPLQKAALAHHTRREISRRYPIGMHEFNSHCRLLHLVLPRQIAMYVTRVLTGWSQIELGRRFGGRDHTTIHYAMRKIGDMINADPEFEAEISDIIAAVHARVLTAEARHDG